MAVSVSIDRDSEEKPFEAEVFFCFDCRDSPVVSVALATQLLKQMELDENESEVSREDWLKLFEILQPISSFEDADEELE